MRAAERAHSEILIAERHVEISEMECCKCGLIFSYRDPKPRYKKICIKLKLYMCGLCFADPARVILKQLSMVRFF